MTTRILLVLLAQVNAELEQPCRTKLVGYPGRMMLRDIKRRTLIRKYWPERFRYQTLRKNMILPDSFKVCCPSVTSAKKPFSRCVRRIIAVKKNSLVSPMKLNRGGDGIDVSWRELLFFDRTQKENSHLVRGNGAWWNNIGSVESCGVVLLITIKCPVSLGRRSIDLLDGTPKWWVVLDGSFQKILSWCWSLCVFFSFSTRLMECIVTRSAGFSWQRVGYCAIWGEKTTSDFDYITEEQRRESIHSSFQMSNQDPISTRDRHLSQHVTSLFGPDDDDDEQVPRSPFVLTSLPPEVRIETSQSPPLHRLRLSL